MRLAFFALPLLALGGCNFAPDTDAPDSDSIAGTSETTAVETDRNMADSMASNDPAPLGPDAMARASGVDAMPASDSATTKDDKNPSGNADTSDATGERPTMQTQVVLDRMGFSPGVIDGKMGMSTRNALEGFQEAKKMKVGGELDQATRKALASHANIKATRNVTIPEQFASVEFTKIPDSPAAQAKLHRLGYESLSEKLAERFHTTPEVLASLNGGKKTFAAGDRITVPNIGADRLLAGKVEDKDWMRTLRSLGVGSEQPEAARIVVDKSDGVLRVFDDSDTLIAQFTATMGSTHDPLPLGEWKILGNAYNPPFAYNPDLFWDIEDSDAKVQLPPGPNGPVGVVWIDLSKEHYGIHGTPDPETIGRAESHGCIRLTNWDAARLAQMVGPGTKATFQA